jgi:hypothetical protein
MNEDDTYQVQPVHSIHSLVKTLSSGGMREKQKRRSQRRKSNRRSYLVFNVCVCVFSVIQGQIICSVVFVVKSWDRMVCNFAYNNTIIQ